MIDENLLNESFVKFQQIVYCFHEVVDNRRSESTIVVVLCILV
jgi:hypothetical protein